ncbi:molybdopterin synthase catalytic subunit MoaE [Catenovulum sp. 2E275]|uniref:molybdopterin synthase catalytic subunit MoaE n=1 Tax=Catenovulum sp. 2E275 TaxID=2980497 RepID=UPI0021CF85DB|nr:molybdopterin synthase catalytic subunit MoaE [Catenovulum sp. 2E275]MCU4677630.1 molybdopterin synthase catalytic subunit MoaE [Catenovulum sp. 2E275]
MIKVQTQDFNVAAEYAALCENNQTDGAVVFFVGLVRDFNQNSQIKSLTLEHYPAMTNKVLQDLEQQAKSRWPVNRVSIVHRVGKLTLAEQIVFVGVTSPHRQAAFEAAQFIMDTLKTSAPFWKKEQTPTGEHWVDAKDSDEQAAKNWQNQHI